VHHKISWSVECAISDKWCVHKLEELPHHNPTSTPSPSYLPIPNFCTNFSVTTDAITGWTVVYSLKPILFVCTVGYCCMIQHVSDTDRIFAHFDTTTQNSTGHYFAFTNFGKNRVPPKIWCGIPCNKSCNRIFDMTPNNPFLSQFNFGWPKNIGRLGVRNLKWYYACFGQKVKFHMITSSCVKSYTQFHQTIAIRCSF